MEDEENITIPKEQRTQVAYKLFTRRILFLPMMAYFGGRTLHYKAFEPTVDFESTFWYSPAPLDRFARKKGNNMESLEAAQKEEAYAREFFGAATLDTLAAAAVSLPLLPIAFLTGLVYTSKEEIKDIKERRKNKEED